MASPVVSAIREHSSMFMSPQSSLFRQFYEKRWGHSWPQAGDKPWNGDTDWSQIMMETMADYMDTFSK